MPIAEKRTQIYLTAEQHGALQKAAHKEGTSMALLVRRAIDAYLATRGEGEKAQPQPDPLGDLIGFIEGPGDLSADHDEHLYGPAAKPPARRKGKRR